MRTHQAVWTPTGWSALLCDGVALAALGAHDPRERFYGCSTAGEIEGTHVQDGTVVASALWLDKGRVAFVQAPLEAAPCRLHNQTMTITTFREAA